MNGNSNSMFTSSMLAAAGRILSGVSGIELATGRIAQLDPVSTTHPSLVFADLLFALFGHFRVGPSVCNK